MALATSIAACGSSASSDSNEPAGKYQVRVTKAVFPTEQQLAQTSLLRIGVRNTGPKTVPALTVTISIAGKAGQTSALPFGYHDPQAGLAQPDRPVWVLAEHFPRLAGSGTRGGATTSSHKTFDFGPLKPGKTSEAIWKVTAVKAGRYTLLFSVDAGLGGQVKAETAGGKQPGGSFATTISQVPPHVVVTDSGEVVEVKPKQKGE
ncbi:MAG TPA: hypothetical protein VG518_01825 [Solirubrobacterales bacterium]|nr:hypothetical protein [Solirubrobacterales bacterium]